MNPRKGIFLSALLQAAFNFHIDIRQRDLRGAIFSSLTQRWLCVIPEAVSIRIVIEVRQRAMKRVQCVLKVGNIFARLNNAQKDSRSFQTSDSLVPKGRSARSAAKHNCSGYATACENASIPRICFIFLIGDRILSVYFTVNDAVPGIRKVANQLITDLRHIQRNGARHNHSALIVCHPKLMNNCCHQTQHTSCALESLQCCPIAIETIEYFWMYRVARYKAVTIFHFLGFKRKIFRIVLIHLAECITNSIAGCFVLAVQKQSAAYNFKFFVCSNWLPNRLHTSKGMLDCFECLLACLATNLNAGFRNRSNHDAVFTCARSFGNLLNECNEIIRFRMRRRSIRSTPPFPMI